MRQQPVWVKNVNKRFAKVFGENVASRNAHQLDLLEKLQRMHSLRNTEDTEDTEYQEFLV